MAADFLKIGAALFLLTGLAMQAGAGEAALLRLVTLDPGHFHAGLVQKFMYPEVSPVVHVYAPEGPDLKEHLARIDGFNRRSPDPTAWVEKVYAGPDFLERMLSDKAGNVVVISGNNARKAEFISRSVGAGLNVLADKPMAIAPADFEALVRSFSTAAERHVLLYDIMTERFEVTTILQRELARNTELFGTLEKGTPEQPAVAMESVHHFFKEVAGRPLTRPAWFYDLRQQGEAVPDVGTHLVDLVQWECFPDQVLDWREDIRVHGSRRWATPLTSQEFQRSTGLASYPEFLKREVGPGNRLEVFQNGEVNFEVRGVNAKITALWKFEAPAGAKDTHYSILRGTRAWLTIKQGEAEHYRPTLYVENKAGTPAPEFEHLLREAVARLCSSWPGLSLSSSGNICRLVVPDKYDVGHEAHFGQVTRNFLRYLAEGRLPAWEVPNMLAKYYITTEAYRLSHTPSKS